jgi:hypothetical protein
MAQEPFELPAEEREAALRYAEEVPFTSDAPPLALYRPDEVLEFARGEPGYGGHVLEGPTRSARDENGAWNVEPVPSRVVVFVKAGIDPSRLVDAARARWCNESDACREPTFPIVVPYSVLEQGGVPSDAYRLNKLRPYLPTTGATAPAGG